jgi:hypothetical protein
MSRRFANYDKVTRTTMIYLVQIYGVVAYLYMTDGFLLDDKRLTLSKVVCMIYYKKILLLFAEKAYQLITSFTGSCSFGARLESLNVICCCRSANSNSTESC